MSLSRKQRGGGHDSIIIEQMIRHLEYFIDLVNNPYDYSDSELVVDTLNEKTRLISEEITKLNKFGIPRFGKARFTSNEIRLMNLYVTKQYKNNEYTQLILNFGRLCNLIKIVYDRVDAEKRAKGVESFRTLNELKQKFADFVFDPNNFSKTTPKDYKDLLAALKSLKSEDTFAPHHNDKLYKDMLIRKLQSIDEDTINYLKHYYEYNKYNNLLSDISQPVASRSTGGRKWSLKYKRSIKCRRPKGFSQKQYCKRQGKKTRRV